jgi:hypothetical protein
MYSPLIAEPSAALAPIRSHGRCISPHVSPDDELSVASSCAPPELFNSTFHSRPPFYVGLADYAACATRAACVRRVLSQWSARLVVPIARVGRPPGNAWPVNWRSGGSYSIGLRDAGVVVRSRRFVSRCVSVCLARDHSPSREEPKIPPRRFRAAWHSVEDVSFASAPCAAPDLKLWA